MINSHNQQNLERPDGAFIQMRRIVKTFKTPAGDFTALKGISVDFHQGEFVSVVGKSGSGKSTLANMITGIDRPTSGEVQIGATHVHQLSESAMAKWRGRNLGVVFQFYQLLPMLSLLENVMLPMDFCNMYPPETRERRALELLDMVGLADYAHKMPSAVSGGQQQSAAIARALANNPPVIIADEPTGNLDSRAAEAVFTIFESLAQNGTTILMVTHDSALAKRAARTLLLADGEVVNATVADVLSLLSHQQMLQATKHAEVRRFAPGEPIIREGMENEHFYMIARGAIDVTLRQADGQEKTIAQMGPGQHFGEVSLLRQSRSIANVRAALHTPVEVLTLSRQFFVELLDDAHTMREALTRTAHERAQENSGFREKLHATVSAATRGIAARLTPRHN
ncbi:MAG TPA: ATP-binding cassette domain-containing protein [Anaerolineae bacterium]|nr:ATP-binding cassette domain-containing protein [Anaerolineae bacterium]HQI86148.1 ATP-binding cassette domain-containing protein [Anaerolineae bacterium]